MSGPGRQQQPGGGGDRKFPVFVFPNSLTFIADDQTQHKQVLTVYNPYEFAVRYKVCSTTPDKYIMADSEGVIRPLCCIDLVIRHNAVTPANINVTDKFRIYMHEHGHKQNFGKKDIPVCLLKTAPPEGSSSASTAADHEQFKQLLPSVAPDLSRGQQYSIASPRQARDNSRTNLLTVVLGLVCAAILTFPLENANETHFSLLPTVSVNLKLIVAFFLGIMVTVFIKS